MGTPSDPQEKEDCVLHQDCNYVHLDAAFHGVTLEWMRKQPPPQPELSDEICSDSHYAIDGVDFMHEIDSAPLRNGVLLQWAYIHSPWDGR